MLLKLKSFIKKEKVFCIAFSAALLSAFIVKPSADYIGYINFSVLMLLFCLMSVTEGLKQCGILSEISYFLVKSAGNLRKLCFVLMTLCFILSMFITNDVALLTFVPLTLMITSDYKSESIKIIVIETIAANLGSMLTPIGNPQNLFIYENSGMNAFEFIKLMLPVSAISYAMLVIAVFSVKKTALKAETEKITADKRSGIIYGILFILCILTVFHLVSYYICTIAVAAVLLIYNRKIFADVDYILLLTFVCFFIFSGNLAAVPQAEKLISGLLEKNTMATAVICSQVISNVPSSILLYPFCTDIRSLLYGVDIGGLGTPVASLASLISYKIYSQSENSSGGKYMALFMIGNLIFLALLYIVALMII